MMAKILRLLILILIFLISVPTYASHILVFVHGYLGDGGEWRPTGIINTLQHNGWQDAGHLFPQGPALSMIQPIATVNYIYTVTLPSEAPLSSQAQWLDVYLRTLQQRHPDSSLIIVGHSAGGVVARLVMVAGKIPVQGLISIASPHLGTNKAELGAEISNSPAGWITPMLGLGTINRSQGLYRDLIRERPYTLLFWLNRQPHPQTSYISVIRTGDNWVAPYSQDMNNVVALKGLSETVVTVGKHSLNPSDGPLLVTLLSKFLK